MIDMKEKNSDILNDYYSTIGKFYNIKKLIEKKEYEILAEDEEDLVNIKEGQKREILVDLGRVGEMAFKYIIKLKQLQENPNQSYEQFKREALFNVGPIKSFANKKGISNSELDEILSFEDYNRQQKHNFHYLYLIVKKLMPDIYKKFCKTIQFNMQSKEFFKKRKDSDFHAYEELPFFPDAAFKTIQEQEKEQEKVLKILEERKKVIENSGDVFTRLRYFANNPFDKDFSIDEIYELISDVVMFIEIIHSNKDNLDYNVEIGFAYYMLKKNLGLVRFSAEELEILFNHEKIKNDSASLIDCLFYSSSLTFENILQIIECDSIDPDDYTSIMTNGLTLETILYFKSIGINDYEEMGGELAHKGQSIIESFLGLKYTLEEYLELKKRLDTDNHPNNISLLNYLTENSIIKLNKYPELEEFLINKFYKNVNRVSYNFPEHLFNSLIDKSILRENPYAWYGLDMDQLFIYWNISEALLKEPLNCDVVNKSNFYEDMLIQNIEDNINYFKDNQKLLCVLPLMLDCDDNKKILDILINNGLDINNLRGLDTTIFCLPVSLVEVIEKLLVYNGIPLIVDNKVNLVVYDVIESINYNMGGKEIKRRRIPFYKTLIRNSESLTDPIINELIYDEDKIPLEFSKEFKERCNQFEGLIKNMTKGQLIKYIERTIERTNKTVSDTLKETKHK